MELQLEPQPQSRESKSGVSRKLLTGALAGVAGTVAMSAFMAAAYRAGALGEPPPKKLVRRTINRLGFGTPKPVPLGVATAIAHLGFGASMGALFGVLPRASRRVPLLPESSSARGALFGLAVWATSYAGWIPKLGLMPSPEDDRPGRPTSMVLAHLIYGAVLGRAFRSLPTEGARS